MQDVFSLCKMYLLGSENDVRYCERFENLPATWLISSWTTTACSLMSACIDSCWRLKSDMALTAQNKENVCVVFYIRKTMFGLFKINCNDYFG